MNKKKKPTDGMGQLFPDEDLRFENEGKEWTPKEDDELLEKHFIGMSNNRLGLHFKRTTKSVKRRIELFLHNNKGNASLYSPDNRSIRTGMRLNENEILFIQYHKKKGFLVAITSRVLCRSVNEIKEAQKAI